MPESRHVAPDFRALFESAPELYLVLTPELRIVAVSEAFTRATMTRREEILGRELFDVFPDNPDDPGTTGVRNWKASLERVMQSRRADTMALQKYDIRRPESEGGGFEERYWRPLNSPVFGEGQEIAYILHSVEDVTEFVRFKQAGTERDKLTADLREHAGQMKAEILLSSRELEVANRRGKLLESFIEQAPVGLAMFDREMRYVRASKRWLEDCGISEEAILGKTHYEVSPDLPEHWKEAHRRGLAGESLKGEDDWVALDGKKHSIRWEIQPRGGFGVDTGGIIVFSEDITGRKAAAESLRESEARFRSMYEHAAVGIEQVAMDGRFLMVNPAMCRMLGYTETELRGKMFTDISHPDDREREAVLLKGLLRTGRSSYQIDKRCLHRDGSPVWVNVTSSLVRDGSGRSLYRISVLQDITERKRAIEALRIGLESLATTEIQFRTLLESASQGVLAVDESGRITLVNAKTEEMFGYRRDELMDQPMDVLLPERYRTEHAHHQRTYFLHPRSRPMGLGLDLSGRRKDGSEFPLEASLSFVAQGERRMALALLTDITERTRTAEALRESEAQFRTLANAIPQLCWMANADGFIFWYNQRWYEYTGTTPEQMEGWGWQSVLDPEALPAVLERWQSAIASGAPLDMVFPLRGADGIFHPFLTRVMPVRDRDGKVTGWFGTNTDISDQRKIEEALRESDERLRRLNAALESRVSQRTEQLEAANRELEAFAYSVSHDLRAPLGGIDAWSLALEEDYIGQLDERARQYLSRVRSEAQRMGLLIDDLLELSRVSREEMEHETVDLTSVAHAIAARLREAHAGRRIEFIIGPDLTTAGDVGLLEIVLTNLLANAVKFTGQRAQARIEFGRTESNGQRAFYVRDDGVGFDMAFASPLFGAFQRLHKASEFPGTGIGLATVQRIIHRHGGRVWAESQPGQGAVFYFTVGAP
jgi:PAS domain S-box-containing protein